MPQAKRSTSTSRFKPPPALKRLSTSLDTAQKALTELTKGSGRDVGKGAGDLYKDMRTFLSSARRESNKLGKSLQREFDQAQKQLAKAAKSTAGRTSSTRSTAKRATTKRATSGSRSTSSPATTSRSTASRSTASRSTGGRSTSARASAKKSTGSGTKRTSSRRGTSKS